MTCCPSHVRLGYESLASSALVFRKIALRTPTDHIERRIQRLRLPCILGGTQATSQEALGNEMSRRGRARERQRGRQRGICTKKPDVRMQRTSWKWFLQPSHSAAEATKSRDGSSRQDPCKFLIPSNCRENKIFG